MWSQKFFRHPLGRPTSWRHQQDAGFLGARDPGVVVDQRCFADTEAAGQRVAWTHKIVTDEIQSKQCVNMRMTLHRSLDVTIRRAPREGAIEERAGRVA
jgi:hypothetical protein